MQDLQPYLRSLGFSNQETLIYLALVEYGPTPASTLAKLTGITRTTVYDYIGKLMEKRLIMTFTQGKTLFYAIDDIQKILHSEQEKLKYAEMVVAALQSREGTSRFDVSFYRGGEGVRRLYEEILLSGAKELLVVVDMESFNELFDPEYDKDFKKKRNQLKMYARILMPESEVARDFQQQDKKLYRETRFIPQHFRGVTSSFFLFEDTVIFFDQAANPTGVRLVNSRIAALHRAIFEEMWLTKK